MEVTKSKTTQRRTQEEFIEKSIKNIYCLNNNINLIIIKYTDDEVKQKICSLLYAAS